MSQFSQHSFANEKALIRVDFNVPLNDKYEITDDTRIRAAIPTIKKVLSDGGSVILMSHWCRPLKDIEKKPNLTLADFSLKPVVGRLSELLGCEVLFADDCISDGAMQQAHSLKPGQVLLLE